MNDSKPVSVKQANAKLTKAFQAYFKARPTFPLQREEFQLGLIEALAKDKDRSVAQVEVQMKRENDQKIMGRNTKCIHHRNLRDPVVRAIVTNSQGEVYECLQEDTMVAAMAKSNLNRQQQINDTPFMTSPLVDIFGYLANDKPAM